MSLLIVVHDLTLACPEEQIVLCSQFMRIHLDENLIKLASLSQSVGSTTRDPGTLPDYTMDASHLGMGHSHRHPLVESSSDIAPPAQMISHVTPARSPSPHNATAAREDHKPHRRAAESSDDEMKIISVKPSESKISLDQSPQHIKTEAAPTIPGLSSDVIASTTLLVCASDHYYRGPIPVPFSECTTLEKLFETVATACDLEGERASKLHEVKVTYLWLDKKRHTMRKHQPFHWIYFIKHLRIAWERHSKDFEDYGCEIEVQAKV